MNLDYLYKLKICYNGYGYFGWQIQNGINSEKCPTIQGALNNALKSMVQSENIKTLGASRTDAGVHALAQVVRVQIPLKINPDSLRKGLNSFLPKEIRVIKADYSDSDFNPIGHAVWKEYQYVFTNNHDDSVFTGQLIANYSQPLDFDAMREVVKFFVGRKDFCNYMCVGTDVASTVREIFECNITHHTFNEYFQFGLNDYYLFRIKGDGFLKQMVRLLVGTMWKYGRGKLDSCTVLKSFDAKLPTQIGYVAPPHGLYLKQIAYLDHF